MEVCCVMPVQAEGIRTATDVLLEADEIKVELDGTRILLGASLQIRPGEVHVLIGPNGAGKTTFANAITGHVPIASGEVRLRGTPLRGDVSSRVRAGIGRKFQVPRVFSRLTAAQNMAVAAGGRSVVLSGPEGSDTIDIGDPFRSADELSHGQRQRLELKMVLSRSPAIAVLDEPTAGMTRKERSELAEIIRSEAGDHTFLIVEHDMDFVETVADRVSFMRDGLVVASGSFAEIAADPVVREVYLGGGHTGEVKTRAARADARGRLDVRGLSVYRGRLESIRDVSLSLEAGGALGVLGRNGAGKTTLLAGLMGLLPTTGSVELDGEEIVHRPCWWRGRKGMALVPQGRQLFPALTVAENLRLATSTPVGDGRLFDIHELFPAIEGLLGRRAGLLSGGEQQQVAIARALLRRPTLLLLDEPTEGLSPVIVEGISKILDYLIDEGLTVVLAEQHRSIVEALCSSFAVLRGGEVAGSGAIEQGTIDTHYLAL